jgi:peptide/nickel transport system permease protein
MVTARVSNGIDEMSISTRLIGYLMVLWLGTTVNFVLPRVMPGDPVRFLIGEETGRLAPERHAAILAEFGLDRPLLEQYVAHLTGLAGLDFGVSTRHGLPVLDVIAARLPWTGLLVGSALLLAFSIGFALACLFHWLPGHRLSSIVMGLVVLISSFPPFWIALVAITVFAVGLGWFPSHGAIAPEAEHWITLGSILRHAALPVGTLTLAYLPDVFLVARASLQEALGSGYVALARAHGAGPLRVLLRQAAPNAVPPLINQFFVRLGGLLGGTVVIETVFAYPGLGLLLYEGILAHDFPLVQTVFLLMVFAVVLTNVSADLVQVLVDPRLRPSHRQGTV